MAATRDIAKLPQWAQQEISQSRSRIESLESEVARLANQERYKVQQDQTDTVVEPYDHKGAVGLSRGAMLEFRLAEDPTVFAGTGWHYRSAITARSIVDDAGVGWLDICGDSGLTIETHSSNRLKIRVRP